jgi:signal transduction histidine kinase
MSSNRVHELELEARREATLEAVTAGLSSAATRGQILDAILEEGIGGLRASAVAAYLSSEREDGAGRTLELVGRRGIADQLARALDPVVLASDHPVARSVRLGVPVWVPSRQLLTRDFPEFARAVNGGFALGAFVALPLRVGGEIAGSLGLAFPEAHAFDASERLFLTTLAERCASAMERARLYEESQAARADAERSRAEIEQLLRSHEIVAGILAHDLKNPLAAVLMNARLLRDVDNERTRAVGRRIVTSGERMARMIDQIFEWTRMRVPSVTIERGDCDLGLITDDVVTELRVRKGDAPLVVEARGDLRGRWDADRLAQVVSNLVGNALDHASRPGAVVCLDGQGAEVRFTVSNEGRIDEQLLPLIFEPFSGRALGAKARGRGLGLGLFISRRIVVAHGGRLELEPDSGDHTTFAMTLPRAPAE